MLPCSRLAASRKRLQDMGLRRRQSHFIIPHTHQRHPTSMRSSSSGTNLPINRRQPASFRSAIARNEHQTPRSDNDDMAIRGVRGSHRSRHGSDAESPTRRLLALGRRAAVRAIGRGRSPSVHGHRIRPGSKVQLWRPQHAERDIPTGPESQRRSSRLE